MTYQEQCKLRDKYSARYTAAYLISGAAALLLLIGGCGGMMAASSKFDSEVRGPISLAVQTNIAPKKACETLRGTLDYMRARGMTAGSTSLIFDHPYDDIGAFHDRVLKAAGNACVAATADYLRDASSVEKYMLEMRMALSVHGTVEGDLQKAPELVPFPSGLAFWPFPNAIPILLIILGFVALVIVMTLPFAEEWINDLARQKVKRIEAREPAEKNV